MIKTIHHQRHKNLFATRFFVVQLQMKRRGTFHLLLSEAFAERMLRSVPVVPDVNETIGRNQGHVEIAWDGEPLAMVNLSFASTLTKYTVSIWFCKEHSIFQNQRFL